LFCNIEDMLKRGSCLIAIFWGICCWPGAVHAQQSTVKRLGHGYYRQPVGDEKKSSYAFDWYAPEGKVEGLRPLVINLHGGGFKLGNKRSASTPFFSRAYAAKGFFCASINYRKSKGHPLRNVDDMKQACFDATDDLAAAIRYFKSNAASFQIDTNRIILAGNSAGAMTVLQFVYRLPADERLIGIKAIVNCWGALFDSTWINNAAIPIVSITGGSDRVVSPHKGAGPACASECIDAGASKAGFAHAIKIYPHIGHELHKNFNPLFAGFGARKRWKTAADFILLFLREQL